MNYFRGLKLLDESCQIYLPRPFFTVWTISKATKEILLKFQLDWKVDIYNFLAIYDRPVNSFVKERTRCLKPRLKSIRNVWKLKKHSFLVYYGF
jgi:hypothetical protein